MSMHEKCGKKTVNKNVRFSLFMLIYANLSLFGEFALHRVTMLGLLKDAVETPFPFLCKNKFNLIYWSMAAIA
jgi:hypothetical protein